MTLIIKGLIARLSITIIDISIRIYAKGPYFIVMLNEVILSVVAPSIKGLRLT